ncbi:MAG: hypothetical protein KR126chlam6_01527 [Candidatus Anoxychlamydiales bacterium]|nr:hypothetical protein [Candidatus Anoxychlamydiales bacterium]
MEKLKQNLKGLYLAVKKDNFDFHISSNELDEKIQKFPSWMNKQINDDFKFFSKKNDIDKTIQNLKNQNLLKKAQLLKVKIKNNKVKYKNYLPTKFYPRFIRFHYFLQKLLKVKNLPDVEFLYSIADSIDDDDILNCLEAPIFCISKKQTNQKVILFPHIEWMSKNDVLLDSICKAALHLSWSQKQSLAFWRGTTTGFLDIEKNERYKVVKLAKRYPQLIDANFSNICQLSDDNQKYLIENFGVKNNISPIEQLKYKYLISIDGNAFGGSFFWQLFSNSVILKNKSSYLEWYYSGLKSDKHFMEFDSDKDLIAKIHWLKDNDKQAQKMSQNANIFANDHLCNESLVAYIYKLLTKQAEILDKQ